MFKAIDDVVKVVQISVISWYKENGRIFPWRVTRDQYQVLVAEILLNRSLGGK